MKKTFLIISLILICVQSFSQTLEIENQLWYKRLNDKEKPPLVMKELINEWQTLLETTGGYPNLPYQHEDDELKFVFIKEYKLNKPLIMNRILEWASLSFGSLDAVLHYKDSESGKIILKGSFEIIHKTDFINFWGTKKETLDSKQCYQTYIFTVKDNKLKIEIESIYFEFTTRGYSVSGYYIPGSKQKFSINYLYPVSQFEPVQWKENLDLLKRTNSKILLLVADLDKYITSFSTDYSF